MNSLFDKLRRPFHPSHVEWKPGAVKGERALAMPYADPRVYMNRLDEVCGEEWSVGYEPWGNDRIICRLTISGVTRSSTGETTNESEKNEIGGTVAEAQAFKRACAMFGLGRYLYNLPSGWVDYDPKTRQFTAQAKSKLTGMLTQHYRRATEGTGNQEEQAVPVQDEAQVSTPEPQDTSQDNVPNDEILEVIKDWRGPLDAQNWSIKIRACDNPHHAREAWKQSVVACGGYTDKMKAKVFVHFAKGRLEKISQQEAV